MSIISLSLQKLPASLKKEIVDNLKYPSFASENSIKGEVWIKVTLTDDSKVKLVDVSATNQQLGNYVKKELSNVYVSVDEEALNNVYYLKVKFDLIENLVVLNLEISINLSKMSQKFYIFVFLFCAAVVSLQYPFARGRHVALKTIYIPIPMLPSLMPLKPFR